MKYSLRLVWYVLRIVLIALSAFAILIVAFFVAMDSANVYVIVTDGMKARATSLLMPLQEPNLSQYFTDKAIKSLPSNEGAKYADYSISDFNYKLDVESLWCNPWKNTATVTVAESIPSMTYTYSQDVEAGKKAPEPPPWQRARYKLTCIRAGDYWRIDKVEKVENLESEPTPSPEPSSYITASPLPTSTPSPSMAAVSSIAASPTPTATK